MGSRAYMLMAVAIGVSGSTVAHAATVRYRTLGLSDSVGAFGPGDAAGAPGLVFDEQSFVNVKQNQSGEVYMAARLRAPGASPSASDPWAVMSYNLVTATWTTRARTGNDGALGPGLGAGVTYSSVALLNLADDGALAFRGSLAGPGITAGFNETGYWRLDPAGGGARTILRNSDPAGAGGLTIGTFPYVRADFASGGRFVSFVTLRGAGTTSANDTAMVMVDPVNGTRVLAREGQAAPGLTGAGFQDLQARWILVPRVANDGTVAFGALLSASSTAPDSLWVLNPGDAQVHAVWSRDFMPVTAGGVTLSSLNQDPIPGPNGRVAAGGYGSGTYNGQVIAAYDGTAWTRVASQGERDPAYGGRYEKFGFLRASPDVRNLAFGTQLEVNNQGAAAYVDGRLVSVFGPNTVTNETSPPSVMSAPRLGGTPLINDHGDMVFEAPLVTQTTQSGGVFSLRDGQMHLLFASHQTFDVDPGPATDLRTISNWQFLAPLTNDGLFSTYLSFDDGTAGLFQFTLPPLSGDANGDGIVDLTDLNLVLNEFGTSGTGAAGDENMDGVVDLTDLNDVLNHFGAGAASAAAGVVPEPTGLGSTLAMAAAALTRRRRRGVQ